MCYGAHGFLKSCIILPKMIQIQYIKYFYESQVVSRKNARPRLCNFSGENTNTTKEISLVVFFIETGLHKGSLREGAGAVGD